MQCRKARKLLLQAVDFAMNPLESQALESHCKSCPDCAQFQDEIARVWEALGNFAEVNPNQTFKHHLTAGLREPNSTRAMSTRHWWPDVGWQWMAVASLALFVAVIASVQTLPERAESRAVGFTKTDNWDDAFLQELESSLNPSSANYLPVYDSWATPLPGSSGENESVAPETRRRAAKRHRS